MSAGDRLVSSAEKAARIRALSNALASILDANAAGLWTNDLDRAAIGIRTVLQGELEKL
jgi:hypothetical protein